MAAVLHVVDRVSDRHDDDPGGVFTAKELNNLARLRQLAGSDRVAAGDVQKITRLKIAFGAEIESVEDDSTRAADPLRPCDSLPRHPLLA